MSQTTRTLESSCNEGPSMLCVVQEDWVGLRQLHEAGKVRRGTSPGGHMQFSLKWFGENVVMPYLAANATGVPQEPAVWLEYGQQSAAAAQR